MRQEGGQREAGGEEVTEGNKEMEEDDFSSFLGGFFSSRLGV